MDLATSDCIYGNPPPRKKAKHLVDRNPANWDLAMLPYNVLLNIFKYLDLKSINNCAILCSTLNNVSKDSILYEKVTLKYNMSKTFLDSFITKISHPRELHIEYKYFDQHAETEDYTEFNEHVGLILRKCGEYLLSLKIESCRIEDVQLQLSQCVNLKKLVLYRCKSTFQTLPTLTSLTNIQFISCHFPQKVVSDIVKNCSNLKCIYLSDNINVNVNEICENMSKYNLCVKEIHLSERKKLKAKSLRTIARLTNLRRLELISGTGFECDPEDSLEQLAAGCPKLERLAIYGWKEITDENFIPALHLFTHLKELDLRGTNITIKTCREAVLTLPLLKTMDVIKCHKVKRTQLSQLAQDFIEIDIPLE